MCSSFKQKLLCGGFVIILFYNPCGNCSIVLCKIDVQKHFFKDFKYLNFKTILQLEYRLNQLIKYDLSPLIKYYSF